MTLDEWQAKIGDWHARAFPWARLPHVLDKLGEEALEAEVAWRHGQVGTIADELADCLVCVLAAMAREGIDAETALAAKFERVLAKYRADEPELPL